MIPMKYPSFAIATLALLVSPLYAQELRTPKPATPPSVVQPYTLDSGSIDNPGAESVVYSKQITFGMTAWLQFRFGELTNLPQGSFLRMTSRKDQDWQVHNAGSLGTWGQNSAGFNGGSVLLELVAGANTKGNRVDLDRVTRGLFGHAATQETPCNTDDRVQTGNSDKRQGRLWMGCTGWLYGICDSTSDLMMSAGHCSTGGTKIMEFDVPNSTAGGTVVRAAVNDQYPYTEEASSNAGVGNDWMVCKVGANSNTGKTPTQWNGGLYYNLGAVPGSTSGQNIRITGYGVFPASGARNNLNQTQQTNVGTLHSVTATSIGHRADSSGGNSGGPVIHENTGDVIGIHTHGGCSPTGSTSSNKGTRVDLAALVAARAALSCSGAGVDAVQSYFGPSIGSKLGFGCKGSGVGAGQGIRYALNGGCTTSINRNVPNEYAMEVTLTAETKVSAFGAFVKTTDGSTRTVRTGLYPEDAAGGKPGPDAIALGRISVGGDEGWHYSRFDLVLAAGTYYFSIDHSGGLVTLSGCATGTAGNAFWRRPPMGSTAWSPTGIISNPCVQVIHDGCSSKFIGRNTSGGTSSNTTAPNEYAVLAETTTAINSCSFAIWSGSNTTNDEVVATAIYADDGSGKPGALLGSGTMTIGPTVGWHTSTIHARVSGTFFVSVDHSARTTYLANITDGTVHASPTAYWRRPAAPSWSVTGLIKQPSYKVFKGSSYNNAYNKIRTSGKSVIDSNYTVSVHQARPNSASMMALGLSDTAWGAIPLPFDLSVIGFTSCTLYVAQHVSLPVTTGGTGIGGVTLPIPNATTWLGLDIFTQFYTFDSGAASGIAFSDALAFTVGNQ
jgi:hypothetical protein